MGDITIHLEPVITNEGLEQLKSTLAKLNANDHINIVVEGADAHQADRVMEILRASGFDYQPRGSHDGRSYHIMARRKI